MTTSNNHLPELEVATVTPVEFEPANWNAIAAWVVGLTAVGSIFLVHNSANDQPILGPKEAVSTPVELPIVKTDTNKEIQVDAGGFVLGEVWHQSFIRGNTKVSISCETNAQRYEVQPGDTVSEIAVRGRETLPRIFTGAVIDATISYNKANGLLGPNANVVHPGDEITRMGYCAVQVDVTPERSDMYTDSGATWTYNPKLGQIVNCQPDDLCHNAEPPRPR